MLSPPRILFIVVNLIVISSILCRGLRHCAISSLGIDWVPAQRTANLLSTILSGPSIGGEIIKVGFAGVKRRGCDSRPAATGCSPSSFRHDRTCSIHYRSAHQERHLLRFEIDGAHFLTCSGLCLRSLSQILITARTLEGMLFVSILGFHTYGVYGRALGIARSAQGFSLAGHGAIISGPG